MWWIIAIVVIVIIVAIATTSSNGKKIDETISNQNTYLQNNNVTKTADYQWRNIVNDTFYRFVVDDVNKKVHIGSGINSVYFKTFNYSDIIGFEVIEDNVTVGGIKRAIAGGILAGGVGAIVGAATANKTAVSSYKAILYTQNISNPTYEMNLIKMKTKTTDSDYKTACDFTTKINGTIKAIMSKT